MKKLSIFMAAAAMCLSASAQLYVTGANVEGATDAWDPSNPLVVNAAGGVYSFKATGNFKISTDKSDSKTDWIPFEAAGLKTGGAWVKGTNTATNTLTNGSADILTPKTDVLITYEVPVNLSTIKATLPDGETFGQEAPKDFYLVGAMSSWNPNDPAYKMSTTDGKTYTYEATSGISGEWKICDGTWNLSYGQGESSNSPALNTLYNLSVNGANLKSAFTQKVTITFNYVEGGQSTLLISDNQVVEYPDLYLVGDCVGGWNDNSLFPAEQMMTREGGVYTATAKSLNGQWLIAAQKTEAEGAFTWNDRFGATADATLELGTAYTMTLGGANMATEFPETTGKEYKLTFNYDAKTVLVEQVDAEAPVDYSTWYVNVIGTFNEWKDNGVNPNEEGISEHEDLAIGTGEFKIKVWNPTDGDVYFSTGSELALNQWIKINGNADANMTIAGAEADNLYNVKFNVKTHEIYVTFASGIETIDAEAADAVYYNLQGVRVDNPVKGLYIRVANGKSQKVMK